MKLLTWISIVALQTAAIAGTWEIESSHSTAKFKIRHLGISNVYGQVTGMKGTFDCKNDQDPTTCAIQTTLDVSTIATADAKRDEHLKKEDFLDVAKFPTIEFKSTKVTKAGGGKFSIVGDMTLHGVTKPITIKNAEFTPTVKDPWGNTRRGFSGTTSINRKDYGITWNKTLDNGGLAIGETVEINLEAELLPPKKDEKKS